MGDDLGAAPYTPMSPSLWGRLMARIDTWWFGPDVTPEHIRRDVAAMSEAERDALMPDFLKRQRGAGGGLTPQNPFGPNAVAVKPSPPPVRGCGARHQGQCSLEYGATGGWPEVPCPPPGWSASAWRRAAGMQ